MAPIRRFEAKAVLFLGLALLSCGAKGARRGLVDNGPTVFDVTKNGALADGQTDCTQAFIQTWNTACKSTTGAAVVLIPPGNFKTGEVFFQGPCTCQSPIVVEVQGTILADTDLTVYADGVWFTIEMIDGLILRGGGTFNGRGEQAWPNDSCGGKAACNNRLPPSIMFNKVNNSIMEGINLVNSKGFHMKIGESYNFTAQDLKITAPGESPNTDGIHISESNLITITNSIIGTGDDCISVGEGSTNVSISGITCGPGHGISIGSLGGQPDDKDVIGISVTNCTLTNTTNGARIKSWHQSPRLLASNIVYEDLIMNDVRNPIFIDQNYGSKQQPGASLVKVSDVHFKNIRGSSTSNVAVSLMCSEAVPCEGIELVDIDFTLSPNTPSKLTTISSACQNAKATFSGKQNPSPCP